MRTSIHGRLEIVLGGDRGCLSIPSNNNPKFLPILFVLAPPKPMNDPLGRFLRPSHIKQAQLSTLHGSKGLALVLSCVAGRKMDISAVGIFQMLVLCTSEDRTFMYIKYTQPTSYARSGSPLWSWLIPPCLVWRNPGVVDVERHSVSLVEGAIHLAVCPDPTGVLLRPP